MQCFSYSPEPKRPKRTIFETQIRPQRPVTRVRSFLSDAPPVTHHPPLTHRPRRATTALSPRKGACVDLNMIPQVSSTPRRQKTFKKAPFITNGKPVPQKPAEIISTSEIEQLKKELHSTRRKAIHWGDSSEQMPYCPYETKKFEPVQRNYGTIIHDDEELDINLPPKPVNLISQTASIMDFLGLPDSVSFIR